MDEAANSILVTVRSLNFGSRHAQAISLSRIKAGMSGRARFILMIDRGRVHLAYGNGYLTAELIVRRTNIACDCGCIANEPITFFQANIPLSSGT